MAVKEGDVIKLNFTGRYKNTDEIYNSTIEEVAVEAGLSTENRVFKPIATIVGRTQLFPEINDAIIGSEVGDKFTVEVPCDHAFGQRNPKLIELIHIREFKKEGITPVPGMAIKYKGRVGKVLTVNGGRVKIDFNDEAAGKDLICDIELCEIIEDDDEIIKAIVEVGYANQSFDFDKTKITRDGNVLNISLDPASKLDQNTYLNVTISRSHIVNDLYYCFEDIEQVNFVDEYIKPSEESETQEENEE